MALWPTRNTPCNLPPSRTHLRLELLEARTVPAAGGGFTGGGILGHYFDNAELAGEPAFVRRDVRIDFDWQNQSPGGSISPDYQRVGADDFSVRWTGQLLPKFSESYTFHLTGDDGARLWVRQAGEVFAWNLLVDTWDTPTVDPVSASFQMVTGKTYDIRVEYREIDGTATARLNWSSSRTPEEAIEPATNVGVNAVTYDYLVYADTAKTGQPGWGDPVDYFGRPKVATDTLGWPLSDAGHMFWSNKDATKTGGTYLLQFTGQAEVSGWIGRGRFRVNGVDIGSTLPLGVGYDLATNTTTAEVVIVGADLFGMSFRRTRRMPADAEGTGVTNVQLMRPIAVNSDISYHPGELFDADFKEEYARFTTLRYLTANFNAEKDWANRKLPDAMQAAWGDRAAVWENEVLLANETGKDLYITIPVGATADYIRNLALLLRFGSDGVMPYTGPVANPVYPGLNPNLRVYVEWGNEIWNWSFSHGGWAADAGRAAVLNNTPDGQIVNFDGQRPNGDFRRWAALRTVEMSNIFRSVWGDAAMGERVRVVFEYQYSNHQNTALAALQFIDRYFNNGDGNPNVVDPHPVNYYIWGAGAAAYYGAANSRGLVSGIPVPGGTFESFKVGPGGTAVTAPASKRWGFAGDAGVYRDLAGLDANAPMIIPDVGKLPATPYGKQSLYISGKGEAWVTIRFPKAGVYAIDFQAASELAPDKGNTLDFYLDDQRITPNGRELAPPPYPWWPGNGQRDAGKFSTYGTVPFEIPKAGKYTFRIVGRGTVDRTTVIDNVRVSSLNAIYRSRVPTGVRAAGEETRLDLRKQLALQASYAQAYGLKVVAYEAGWSLGGDGAAVPIQSWAKYNDPRTSQVMLKGIEAFYQAGGEVYVMGVYDQWYLNDVANADSYPIVKGIDASLARLPDQTKTRTVVRGSVPQLVRPGRGYNSLSMSPNALPGEWVSWTVNVKVTSDYRVTAKAAKDGFAAVIVDGIEVGRGSSGERPGGIIRLEAGIHTIRIQSIGGFYRIGGLIIARLDTPLTP